MRTITHPPALSEIGGPTCAPRRDWWRPVRAAAAGLLIVSVQSLVCGFAAAPVALAWYALLGLVEHPMARATLIGALAVPAYVTFAVTLLVVSPLITRLSGGRTPMDAELRIADLSWPLLRWCHYAAAHHLVRVFAGTLFRGSPVWSVYLRLNGARIGRRVYVNSIYVADHDLLEIGDDVVIGSEVHLSAHTVEAGVVKTAPIRIGRGTTIGLGSVIDIGAEIGADCQVGALTFVPKHAHLRSGATYVGIPARRLEGRAPQSAGVRRP